MSDRLTASFEMRYRGGAVIEAAVDCPASGFAPVVLFGPSGCGKTTVLRCLAGLERPLRGRIEFAGEPWFDAADDVFVPPHRRGIGFMFQEYALFPHLTVAGNVEYGIRDLERAERRRRVDDLMEFFDLKGLGARRPTEISGGQQQRVALARTVARRPRLLLLDEPLSALDSTIRDNLRLELRRMLAGLGLPTLIVTHDRREAVTLGDEVIILDNGRVKQRGSAGDVFSRPVDSRAAEIVGVETVERGTVVGVSGGLATVRVGPVELVAPAPRDGATQVLVCIRAEDVILELSAPGASSARNHLPARIVEHVHEGALTRVSLDCGFPLTALVTQSSWAEMRLAAGMPATAIVKAAAIHLIPR